MVPFSVEAPSVMHFGNGMLEWLPHVAQALGNRVLMISGNRWLSSSPWRAQIEAGLGGVPFEWWRCPPEEPSIRSLAAASREAVRFGPEVIVAVGGGSVLDTAKALSILLRYPGPPERFLEGVEGSIPVPARGIPWVAVPTTAGTGAEVTKNAVIRSDALGMKRSMRSVFLLASAVIVDPLLTVALPLGVTGTSGLDALTQLVESYVSRTSNPFVRSLVEGAFAGMLEALQRLPDDPTNAELRAHACYGATISGIALANAGLGAAHGLAASIGGAFEVPHGLACAVFLPHVLEANAAVIREDLSRLLGRMMPEGPGGDPAAWLASEVRRLLARFGLPSDLRGFCIPRDRLREIAEKASGASMKGNPRELPIEERMDILSRVT